MAGPAPAALVFFNDGGACLLQGVEDEQQQEVLLSLAAFMQDSIYQALRLPQFRHVQIVEVDTSEEPSEGAPSSFSLCFAPPAADDAQVAVADLRAGVDLKGLLLGTSALPKELESVASIAVDDETQEPGLQCSDEQLAQRLAEVSGRSRLDKRYTKFAAGQEEALRGALDAAAEALPDGALVTDAIDPYDVVQLALMQVIKVAGFSALRPSLLGHGRALIGRVLGVPAGLLRQVRKRLGRVQRLWWQLEDGAVSGGKRALKLAVKSARPLLVALVLHRVLRTLERSRSPGVRMLRMGEDEKLEYYYSTLLGPDWRQQLQQDWDKAVADVNEGLVTDEINHEKRKMTAAALRRLEIEEWDKQRMKNFYLASYGGLRWFDAMEQALHSPMLITSRGWTDPIPNWVGENQAYGRDMGRSKYWLNLGSAAIELKEKELGRALTQQEVLRTMEGGGSGALAWAGLVPGELKQRSATGSGSAALAAAAALAK